MSTLLKEFMSLSVTEQASYLKANPTSRLLNKVTSKLDIGTLHFKAGIKTISVKTFNTYEYSNGFSFQVKSELEAFQAAYNYRHAKETKVEPSADNSSWVVAVTTK